jgi:hypothetical protein
MVSIWPGMREMQARRAPSGSDAKEVAMANREQKGDREKKKPKGAPVVSSFGTQPTPSALGK